MQTFAAANANQWVTDISVTTDVGLLKRLIRPQGGLLTILPLQGAGV